MRQPHLAERFQRARVQPLFPRAGRKKRKLDPSCACAASATFSSTEKSGRSL
jgi:hypothetical protein